MHTSRTRVAQFMPGWTIDSITADEPEGSLVSVHSRPEIGPSVRFRTVWIANDGTVTDAKVDDLGNIVTAEGLRLAWA